MPTVDVVFRHTMQNQVSLSRLFTGHEAPYDCSKHSDLLRVTFAARDLSGTHTHADE